jgi:hypothetical protein
MQQLLRARPPRAGNLLSHENDRHHRTEKAVARAKVYVDAGGCHRGPKVGPNFTHSTPERPMIGPDSKSYIFCKKSVFGPDWR